MTNQGTNKTVKVIKGGALKTAAERGVKPQPAKTTQQTAREMVQNVTNWVSELQQRKRTETARAIKNLFPEPPQPKEA
jgi:hypothetical protein